MTLLQEMAPEFGWFLKSAGQTEGPDAEGSAELAQCHAGDYGPISSCAIATVTCSNQIQPAIS